jgi:hypothetical protein
MCSSTFKSRFQGRTFAHDCVKSFGRLSLLLGLIIGSALGCRSVDEPTDIARIELRAPDGAKTVAIAANTGVRLVATAIRADGSVDTGGQPFTFLSRNPTAVTVDSTGFVATHTQVVTYVVATLNTGGRLLSDSVQVVVAGPLMGSSR